MERPIIFTGIRPTGELHLGHYFSLIRPIKEYYETHQIFLMIADLHALTELRTNEIDYNELLNELSINTARCIDMINQFVPVDQLTIFRQSDLRRYHYDLFYKLLMLSRHNQTFGNPVFQDAMRAEFFNEIDMMKLDAELKKLLKQFIIENPEILWGNISKQMGNRLLDLCINVGIKLSEYQFEKIIKTLNTRIGVLGLSSYPVLMAADIILYDPKYVLVGKDQSPHLQITNDFIRILNQTFNKSISPIAPLIVDEKTIKGNDGNKMSKTLGNYVPLKYFFKSTVNKSLDWFMQFKTYPRRKEEAGDPDQCPVAEFYRTVALDCVHFAQCREGQIGCVTCKYSLHDQVKTLIIDSALEKRRETFSEDVLSQGFWRALERMQKNKEIADLISINY